MKIHLHLILLFLFAYHPVHAQFDVINTGTTRYIYHLKLVDNMVLINGNNFLGKCYGGCDTVLHLSMPDDYPYPTGKLLQVIDSSTYYVMTGEAFPHHYLVYKTVDGGKSWKSIFDTTGILIHEFAMMDTSVGMLFATQRRMLRTTDGWETWTENNNSLIVTTAVEVFNDSIICIGTLEKFRISKDKGETWKGSGFAQNTPRRFFFLNKDTLFAISYSNHGALFSYSLNEGSSWIHSGLSIYPNGIYFKSLDEGYVLGHVLPSDMGVIIKTTDLGQTWQTFNTGINTSLTDMKFINDSIALISGSGGVLLRWNTKDTSFTTSSTYNSLAPKNGISIFPNPAIHLQKIEITTGKQEPLSVELFDLQGRLVKTVYKGKPLAGENIFSVDFSPLAAGVYYYRIMLGEKYYFQKTVKDQAP